MIRRLLIGALIGITILVTPLPAQAAPITCPPGQDPVHTDAGWQCVNHGGSGNPNTEETKNPND